MPEAGLLSQMQARDEGVTTLDGPDGRARLYAFATLYGAHASASNYLYTALRSRSRTPRPTGSSVAISWRLRS